jgi:hypothetical protein
MLNPNFGNPFFMLDKHLLMLLICFLYHLMYADGEQSWLLLMSQGEVEILCILVLMISLSFCAATNIVD